MSLSYGEISALTEAWDAYKKQHELIHTDGGDAYAFIDTIKDVYPTEADADEIFSLISVIEEC